MISCEIDEIDILFTFDGVRYGDCTSSLRRTLEEMFQFRTFRFRDIDNSLGSACAISQTSFNEVLMTRSTARKFVCPRNS